MTIPDFSRCSGLERLTLARCHKLKRIESFIGDLRSLIELKIEKCRNIKNLPEEVGALVKLKHLSLLGCGGLKELPDSLGNLMSLTELDLIDTGIAKLPNSMKGLLKLKSFLLKNTRIMEFPDFTEKLGSLCVLGLPKNDSYSPEHHVWHLPRGIGMLENREEQDLSGRDEMNDEILVGIGEFSPLRILKLSSTQVCEIPRTIDMLDQLASSHPELASLCCLDLEIPAQLPSSLLRLDLLCSSIKWAELLPTGMRLRNLATLEFHYVEVEDIPLHELPQLESLTVDRCRLLRRLNFPSMNLRQAHVSSCPDLVDIHAGVLLKLESFHVLGCAHLRSIRAPFPLKNLKQLEIRLCDVLDDVLLPLNKLESLTSLKVRACPSLQSLIDASRATVPYDCVVEIQGCGDTVKDSTPSDPSEMSFLSYLQEILLDTSNFQSMSDKVQHLTSSI